MKQKRAHQAGYLFATLLLTSFSGANSAATQVQQHAAQQFSFNLPAKPVTQAVNDIGRITGLSVVFREQQEMAAMGNPVRGTLSAEQALATLLNGTGLGYRFSNATTVQIYVLPPSARSASAGTPDTMVVQAQGNSRLGPVVGYVASNSTSGTKTNTPLMRTPQSVSVITREQADAQGAQSLVQALRYSSGVAAEVRGSASRYDLPYVRGFGSPTDSNQYLDGLRLLRGGGYAIPQIETYGIERIEFLKGPSSTLYGGVTPGGLINAISKVPTSEPQHAVEMLYGSHNRMQLGVDSAGPLNDDRSLLYRVVALGRKSDTQVVNTKEERVYVAPSLTWIPDTDTSFTLNMSYQHDPEGGYYGVLPTVGSLWPSPAGKIPRNFNDGDPAFDQFDRKQSMVGYQFEHRINDTWSVRHNFRYLDHSTVTKSVGTSSMGADGHTISRYALGTDETLRGLTSDLQLQAEFDTGRLYHTALFGFDYQQSDWTQIRDYGGAPSIDFLNPVYGVATNLALARITNQKQHTNQAGFYAQDQIDIDRWTLVGGMRYDTIRTRTDNRLNDTRSVQDDEAVSGKLGLIYNFDMGIAPYISYSTSFLPVNGTDASGSAFKPTTAKQREVGVKYQPTHFNALFTLAYFDITQSNVVTSANPYTTYQTGEQRSRGVEFESKMAVTDNINVTGALTYTNAEVVKGLGADVGQAPIGIPDYTASLWADYRFRSGALEGITVGSGVRYVGSTVGGYSPNVYTVNATRLDAPSYTVFDASVSYDFGKRSPTLNGLSGKVSVNNLFDKRYVTCLSNNFCNYGNDRVVYASLAYRW
ncbi:TonB-dependent siderophore receptor [Candidatus Symbiopectobacterium sp. NZEC127]|uniref:TonB-dependent siderophore receptor n=1 Tax=Candidatus Symbiopectobacterium sp. NZEC127 TaxID=2820472 RepID=UPI002227368C|nr:TonB-dependent siderophore receptor [Candidatus Symbiopectobacterium sp. NZEC127]MCW2486709.1 TonB-dependent siderophore receptor [Candidatus Symbiopectobacterium sp. NZEC127]